jgi:hypothetical protein
VIRTRSEGCSRSPDTVDVRTRDGGVDGGLHLHGLHHQQFVALLDLLVEFDAME